MFLSILEGSDFETANVGARDFPVEDVLPWKSRRKRELLEGVLGRTLLAAPPCEAV
jgi:hypothetical protein